MKNTPLMKAWINHKYGGPEILQLEEIEKPKVKAKHLLVKVKANSVNPVDWHILRGDPFAFRFALGLFKPKQKIPGSDFSGIVEEVGEGVTHFKVGDRVFGDNIFKGAYAEYCLVPAKATGKIAGETSFPEMAAVPIAGISALQGLITDGKMQEGHSVLINGASGGVGHFAVQIAKAYGAKVTAVCSAEKKDFVLSLGADRVIPYDKEDIRDHGGEYDLILDLHGNLKHKDMCKMGKRAVVVGFNSTGQAFSVLLKNIVSKFPLTIFKADANTKDLETLAELIVEGKVKVHIGKKYSYQKTPEAITQVEKGGTSGKVVMEWE
jgi:NADPH:quinone reductase-like Zn-dependent oxidoreductase